jgi:hypothetical protein
MAKASKVNSLTVLHVATREGSRWSKKSMSGNQSKPEPEQNPASCIAFFTHEPVFVVMVVVVVVGVVVVVVVSTRLDVREGKKVWIEGTAGVAWIVGRHLSSAHAHVRECEQSEEENSTHIEAGRPRDNDKNRETEQVRRTAHRQQTNQYATDDLCEGHEVRCGGEGRTQKWGWEDLVPIPVGISFTREERMKGGKASFASLR